MTVHDQLVPQIPGLLEDPASRGWQDVAAHAENNFKVPMFIISTKRHELNFSE